MVRDTRTSDILEAVVREFIETGEPVSSGWLFDHYDFGIRPAMIRSELNDLTERGFLDQAHHSGGRVPRNRAYEFFAEQALSSVSRDAQENAPSKAPFAHLLKRGQWSELASELSDELGMLGVVGTFPPGLVYKEGLEELIDHLDWDSRSEVKSVIRDFEDFEDRIASAMHFFEDDSDLKVFVGKKSPVTKSEQLSVMVRGCESDGARVFFFAIGPKRMDYQRVAQVLRGLGE